MSLFRLACRPTDRLADQHDVLRTTNILMPQGSDASKTDASKVLIPAKFWPSIYS